MFTMEMEQRKSFAIVTILESSFFFSIEGGYGKTPATANPEANQPLDKSMFSECAMRHVHAMIDPYDAEARFGSSSKE
jgi:hypothetical protein